MNWPASAALATLSVAVPVLVLLAAWLFHLGQRRARRWLQAEKERDLDLFVWAAIGRLSMQLTHDANNALASILGHAQIGLASRKEERLVRALETTKRSGEELKGMLQSLTDLTPCDRLGNDRENLADSLKPILRVLQRPFDKASIRIRPVLENVPPVLCNRQTVSAAVAALLVGLLGELKSAGGGELTVRLERIEESAVGLTVEGERTSFGQISSAPAGCPSLEERLAVGVLARHGVGLEVHRSEGSTRYLLRFRAAPARELAAGPSESRVPEEAAALG